MPTGYTDDLCTKEVSFQDFALTCARAFGACVMLRDEPLSPKIPKFKPSSYHKKELARLNKKLERLQYAQETVLKREFAKVKAKNISYFKSKIEDVAQTKARLEKMLEKVAAYNPPSAEYIEYKNFMREQLISAIDFDGNDEYYLKELAKWEDMEFSDWMQDELSETSDSIIYHIKENKAEVERTNSRNLWVSQLKKSLKNIKN
jgi:hypothetical protein